MSGDPRSNRLGLNLSQTAVPAPDLPAADPAFVVAVEQQIRIEGENFIQRLRHHGVVGTLDIFNQLHNPGATVNIISYAVPPGQLAILNAIALVCHNPAVTMANLYVWRLLIDGNELPNVQTSVIFGNTGYRTNVGNPHRPMKITPVVVQSNQVITIQVIPSANLVGRYCVFVARLEGSILNPGSLPLNLLGGY